MLTLLVAGQGFAAGGFVKTLAAAEQNAKAGKKLIFVDLFADWCGWCHRFEKEVVPSEAFQKATDGMVLLRLDTEDRAEGTKFAQQYRIRQLPTFLILNHDLTLAGVINGYAPAAQFAAQIDRTVAEYRTFQELVKKEPKLTSDFAKRLEIARAFRSRQRFAESETRLKALTSEKGVPESIRDQAYLELAAAYLDQNRLDQALKTIADFKKVQKAGETFERANLLAGHLLYAQGNFVAAAEEFRAFKTRFPNSQFVKDVDMVLPMIERQLAAQR